jgi:hypothetical protein
MRIRSIKRAFGINEGIGGGDPGAAQDAIGDLTDIVEQYDEGRLDDTQLKRELIEWFKASIDSIRAALGMEDIEKEAKEPDFDTDHSEKPYGLAKEGGPGSGPKPGGAKPVKNGKEKSLDITDDPMDDEAIGDTQMSEPSTDVMAKLRQIIQDLESIVPDEDPEGDVTEGRSRRRRS